MAGTGDLLGQLAQFGLFLVEQVACVLGEVAV
jgi:hypothetical protein